MVFNFVHQACHGHVLPKVFFNTLVAWSSLLHGSMGLVEEGRQPCHVSEQGVEGHHAEGGRHHAMRCRLVSSTCPVQVRKVGGCWGGGGEVWEEGEGETMVLLCQESC